MRMTLYRTVEAFGGSDVAVGLGCLLALCGHFFVVVAGTPGGAVAHIVHEQLVSVSRVVGSVV